MYLTASLRLAFDNILTQFGISMYALVSIPTFHNTNSSDAENVLYEIFSMKYANHYPHAVFEDLKYDWCD